MKKLESTFRNTVLVLLGISVFAAVAIASVYTLTKKAIEKSRNPYRKKEILESYEVIYEQAA